MLLNHLREGTRGPTGPAGPKIAWYHARGYEKSSQSDNGHRRLTCIVSCLSTQDISISRIRPSQRRRPGCFDRPQLDTRCSRQSVRSSHLFVASVVDWRRWTVLVSDLDAVPGGCGLGAAFGYPAEDLF